MSRTKKGSKSPGYDYWTRRPGNEGGCAGYGHDVKRRTHKVERQQNKPTKDDITDAMVDLAEARDKCGDPHCEYCGTTPNRLL